MTRRLAAPGTLIGAMRAAVERRGAKIALRRGRRAFTFAEFEAAAERAGGALVAGGVRPGQVVAIACEDPATQVVAHFGVLWAGAVSLPVRPESAGDFATLLTASDARAVLADAPLLQRAVDLQQSGRWEPVRLFVTSGSLGEARNWPAALNAAPAAPELRRTAADPAVLSVPPGGAPLATFTQHDCVRHADAVRRAWEWTAADVSYAAGACWDALGLQLAAHVPLLAGATAVWSADRTVPASLAHIAEELPAVLVGDAAAFERWCAAEAEAPAPAPRRVALCDGPASAALAARIEARFGRPVSVAPALGA